MIHIRPMTSEDIDQTVKTVLAGGWPDLRSHLHFYVSHPACQPFVAERDGQIVGTATGTVSGASGWLGHIFTAPEHRGQGIGTTLTQTVMAYLEGKGCRSLLLGASELGQPIYEKLGFRVVSTYHFLRGPYRADPARSPRVQPLSPSDLPELCAFDRQVTGEDRSHLWHAFHKTGWVTRDEASGEMTGYAMVAPWETGPVIARNAQDARLLLEQVSRAADDEQVFAALLSENAAGLAALEQAGFTIRRRVPRMLKGEPLQWEPALIWRIFGLSMG